MVDALKYLTSLSYNVLSYTIVDLLASGSVFQLPGCIHVPLTLCLPTGSRSRLKSDGTNEAHWLQGLATFTGALYRKYPSSLELQVSHAILISLSEYI